MTADADNANNAGQAGPNPLDPAAHFETICTHLGEDRTTYRGAATPPIYQASTFVYPTAEAFEQRRDPASPHFTNAEYTRRQNPTTEILEAKLARLENGTWARCFASGMGAITAAINVCVKAGSHIVAIQHCYGPTEWYFNHIRRFGVELTMVDSCDPADLIAAVRPNTTLMYLESPTSGTMMLPPIELLTRFARARGITTIFDNSWATPYFQRPLDLGCDLIVHSATKFLGGHSDLVAGAMMGNDPALLDRILYEAELLGATLDPFAAWLMLRGVRTLGLRMERHQKSGLAVARMLAEHPKVERVNHPGLESHPHHAVARRQLRGYSGLFSFRLKEQTRAATNRFMNRLKLFGIGVSWGGFESLVVGGTIFSTPEKPEYLIRLHVGLESTEDLVADVRQALE
jgi:cystathionine beta-lyase